MCDTFQSWVRSNIRPFNAGKHKPGEYPTSWAGMQSFEQIHENLAHYASNVMQNFGIYGDELTECLQIGFVALWETLVAEPDFLAEKTRKQTVFFILARCKISTFRYQANMYDSLDALIGDDRRDTADENTITGLEYDRSERWAAWATEIDMRVDIERIMVKLAEKYMPSLKHMVALYYLTTQVGKEAAANIATSDVWRWYQRYGLYVQQELQYEFAEVFLENHSYPPAEPFEIPVEHPNHGRYMSPYQEWREKYKQGNTAPAEALLEKYRHTVCVAGAIRAQIEGKTYLQAAKAVGRNPKTFPRHMKRAARMLAAAYA